MIEEDADQADVDESVARHLERALHLREELGARDERSAALSERAGELFAAAGSRAFAAIDYITSRDLLGRAAALLPERSPRRFDLLPNLGAALADSGRTEEAEALLSEAVEQARAAGSERDALRAAVSSCPAGSTARPPMPRSSRRSSRRAPRPTRSSRWTMTSVWPRPRSPSVTSSHSADRIAEAPAWASKALRHALAAGRPREATQAAGDVVESRSTGRSRSIGSRPCARSCSRLGEPISGSVGHALMAVAALAAGDDLGFREHEGRWRDVLDRHGLAWLAATHGLAIAYVEISVGEAEAAERRLREAREFLAAIGNIWWVGPGRRIPVRRGRSAGSAARVPPARRRVRGLRPDDRPGDPHQTPTVAREGPPAPRVRPRGGSRREARAQARRSPPTWCSITRTRCSCSPRSSTRAISGDDAAAARSEAIAKLRAKGNLAAVARLGVSGHGGVRGG